MARITISPLISALKGTIDRITYSTSAGIAIAKRKIQRDDVGSAAQATQRNYFIAACRLWDTIEAVGKLSWENAAQGNDATGWNTAAKGILNALRASAVPPLNAGGALSALTQISTRREQYSIITWLNWTPADLIGTQRAGIWAIEKYNYGYGGEIKYYELDNTDATEYPLTGLDGFKEYWIIGIKFDNTIIAANNCSSQVYYEQGAQAMSSPIGTIAAWHKSLAGTPTLPSDWVECNGQVLNDPASVYDGATIPDLNGDSRYLRGGAASGAMQAQLTAKNGLSITDHPKHKHTTPALAHVGNSGSWSDGNSHFIVSAYPSDYVQTTNTNTARTSINHVHSINHTHPANETGENTDQAHTLNGDTETRPVTMVVVWIMRIK